jgi:hypothetical protein
MKPLACQKSSGSPEPEATGARPYHRRRHESNGLLRSADDAVRVAPSAQSTQIIKIDRIRQLDPDGQHPSRPRRHFKAQFRRPPLPSPSLGRDTCCPVSPKVASVRLRLRVILRGSEIPCESVRSQRTRRFRSGPRSCLADSQAVWRSWAAAYSGWVNYVPGVLASLSGSVMVRAASEC